MEQRANKNINQSTFLLKVNLPNETTIRFKRLELANITNEGQNSDDNEESYHRLAELANDFKMLVSAFGSVLGRVLYWLPVSWKAGAYIKELTKAIYEKRPQVGWILVDENEQTIGLLSLCLIEKEKYNLDTDLNFLKLYNIGLMLHSDFQRKGIATELSNKLFNQLGDLNFDVDGLFIATLPNNIGVNVIAKKLNFTFVKEIDVEFDGMIPCFSSYYLPNNIYIKKLVV